jgi:uncharacterized protein (DUF58 family)
MSDPLGITRTPDRPGPGPTPEALLRALDVVVRRRIEAMLTGDHRSSTIGIGTELAQIRLYQPGDDVRRIDWNVTARTGDIHVRDQIAERALVSWLVLDTSPSMSFGTADRRKADVAEGVALAVGHVGTRHGNRLGLITFGDAKPVTIPSRQGRAGLLGMLATVRREPQLEGAGATSLGEALARTGRLASSRSLIFVVSDFRGPRDWRRELIELAGRHDVIAVEIRDPREQELPDVGELWLVDPETGRQLRVDTSRRRLRERFATAAAGERAELATLLQSSGADHVVLWTAGDWLRSFAGFLRHRVTGPSGARRPSTPAAARPTSAPSPTRGPARPSPPPRRRRPRGRRSLLAPRPAAGRRSVRGGDHGEEGRRPVSAEWPGLLWTLLLVPVALAAYLLAQRRRSRYTVRFTNLDLLANVVSAKPGWRRHVPPAFYLLALAALLVSLARPQAMAMVPKEQATIVLVMDVSGSMNATDVEPTRLVSSQRAATTFIEQLPEKFRVGIVSFASTAQTLTRPTTDRAAVYEAVSSLHAEGATAMGDGIERALDVKRPPTMPSTDSAARQSPAPPSGSGSDAPLVVLLLSDGANTQGRTQPMEAAADAKALGVPVFTIALGTDGGMVDVPDETGNLRRIPVPPDELTLQRIAETTGARFFAAPTARDLKNIYRELGSKIGFVRERQEITVVFAATGLLFLVAGAAMSLVWFSRFP